MKFLSVLILSIFLSSCSKMEEKKTGENTNTPNPHSTSTETTENRSSSENKSTENKEEETDEKAVELSAAADKTIAAYQSDNSDTNKKELISTCMAAANYLMFDATLPAREKYRPALKYYRQVLEADPNNEEAMKNKNEIERIYESMGMPIPK